MPFDSRKSRDAERFDAFRVGLMRKSIPVSKELRKEWFEKFQKMVEEAFPEPNKMFKKPGMASRLFAAEVELPHSNARDMEAMSQHLDVYWHANKTEDMVEVKTLITEDRTDIIWEFVIDLGESYVTGSVKLRNFSFDRGQAGPREGDDRGGDRPPYRGGGDRDRGGDRGGYRGGGDRDRGGDRGGYRGGGGDRGGDRGGYRGGGGGGDRRGGGGGGYRGNRDGGGDRRGGGGGGYRGNRDGGDRRGGGGRPYGGGGGGGFKRSGPGGSRPPFKRRPPQD